jgi:predicted ester cyclase
MGGRTVKNPIAPEENKALVRRMMDWWTEGDVAVLDQTHSPDFVAHTPNGDVRGRDAQKERLAVLVAMFADRRLAIEELIAEGDTVAMRYTWEATHAGEAFGMSPTGNRVRSATNAFYRIAGGKIAEEWEEHDTADLMRQLRSRQATDAGLA